MKPALMIDDLPMDKTLDRKDMAKVHGGFFGNNPQAMAFGPGGPGSLFQGGSLGSGPKSGGYGGRLTPEDVPLLNGGSMRSTDPFEQTTATINVAPGSMFWGPMGNGPMGNITPSW